MAKKVQEVQFCVFDVAVLRYALESALEMWGPCPDGVMDAIEGIPVPPQEGCEHMDENDLAVEACCNAVERLRKILPKKGSVTFTVKK